ncbi:MAG TPA: hypothetical protein VIM87_28780 [Chitinophaga sp.]|uniref:hypothetical protein n=1 Tax=Chitinophaga sp. TaxID=1869181 RepID=UPI002F95B240
MLKAIYRSGINWSHLMIINAVAFVMTFLVLYVIVLIEIALIFNSPLPVNWGYWIEQIYWFLPAITLYPVIYYKMKRHYKYDNPAKAKSYLAAFAMVLLSTGVCWIVGTYVIPGPNNF